MPKDTNFHTFSKRIKNDDPESKIYWFVASTGNVDRHNDIINQKGWKLENFKKNPVIFWNHRTWGTLRTLPIGKGIVKIENDQLLVGIEFDPEDEFAMRVESKVKNGYVNSVSVGFGDGARFGCKAGVHRSTLPEGHDAIGTRGYYYEEAELLEISPVNIPANAEANKKGLEGSDEIVQLLTEIKALLSGETKNEDPPETNKDDEVDSTEDNADLTKALQELKNSFNPKEGGEDA